MKQINLCRRNIVFQTFVISSSLRLCDSAGKTSSLKVLVAHKQHNRNIIMVHPTKAYFFDFHNKTLFDRIYRIDRIVFRSLRKSDMKDSSALRRVNAGEVQTLPAIPYRLTPMRLGGIYV